MLALQRYEPAQALLEGAVKADDKNARAWYNLGLLQKGLGNADASLAAFTRASELAPADAHARYFVGLIASQSQKYDNAIAAFSKALEADPFLVSAEFGLARAYQRSGKPDDAKTHMDRFTRMTQSKVASAMSLAYGDQGPLSLAAAAQLPPAALTAIPVTFVVDSRLPIGDRAGVLGDFDNDEHDDLATVSTQGVRLFHDDGHGNFVDVTEKVGLPAAIEGAVGVTFVDVDHDGDLDLIVTGSHTRLFRNNGNSTFTDVTVERGFDIPNTVGVVGERPEQRSRDRPRADRREDDDPAQPARRRVQEAGRVRRDRADGHPRRRRVRLRQGRLDGSGVHVGRRPSADAVAEREGPVVRARGSPGVDAHGGLRPDGRRLRQRWLAGSGRRGRRPEGRRPAGLAQRPGSIHGRLLARRHDGRVSEATARRYSPAISTATTTPTSSSPMLSRAPVRLRNDGGNASHAIRLALTGLNDNRSGIGTKVEVQAGAIWQKFETTAASSLLGSHAAEILAGIGQATEVDVVRLLWPTGVVQDEVQLAANAPHKIQQIDRRGSSCPILFSWNGTRFEFISDTIGPAVIGHWVAPGEYDTPDTDEFVKVDGSKVRVKDGVLSFHFTEPMEEINYLDQVKLFAVDHPERHRGQPERVLRRRAAVSRGQDARQPRRAIAARRLGRQGPRPAARPARGGPPVRRDASRTRRSRASRRCTRSSSTSATLDTGAPLRLLMRGFTDYFTATSMFAARSGEREGRSSRIVEAQRADGIVEARQRRHRLPRRPAAHDDGGPHGQAPRRHAAHPHLDEPEDLLGPGARGHDARRRRFRSRGPRSRSCVRRWRSAATRARSSARRRPTSGTTSTTSAVTGPTRGIAASTRSTATSRRSFATPRITSSSSDRATTWPSSSTRRSCRRFEPGWTRDYEIYLNGFVKDMDFWGAFAQTVTPLPFKAMPSYPYPATVEYPASNRGVPARLEHPRGLGGGTRSVSV